MHPEFPPNWRFVLFSESQAGALGPFDGHTLHGYWSHDLGWTTFENATRFTASEMERFRPPQAASNDIAWVTLAAL
jgi:hypothetical protein